MTKFLPLLLGCACALLLSACTSAQIYDSLQDNSRDACYKGSEPERAGCLKRSSESYEQYKKQRDAGNGEAKK
ncbi:hypothetical protein ACFOLJ_10515 [Rugamonas sp. CCM 8940]|uniref:hypothetical protein n=1 Tax=Rugamonas sp. CCM 8940 TaxID=2765359 RepID=UPI0018F3D397|nr:hypothetical protein [Rugamonas sp. CCM 8940]MBJ7309814.1 hypothetical protein [Rugamonas sp. CCM 8940]